MRARHCRCSFPTHFLHSFCQLSTHLLPASVHLHAARRAQGAARPEEEEFWETPVGGGDEDVPAPLRGVHPDTPIMM